MEHAHGEGDSREAIPSTTEPAALRDAAGIAARVASDEAAADAERERLRTEGLPVLPLTAEEAIQLRPGEVVHAERRAALLERRRDGAPIGGVLYLTSHRLLHLGAAGLQEISLTDIADVGVALERLLLVEGTDGSDLAIEVDAPRLLRVQVSAARAAARERDQPA
jgi:hypothetical protein